MMKYRRHFKDGLRLIIEADGTPVTIAMVLSKTQILKLLDYLLPNEEVFKF